MERSLSSQAKREVTLFKFGRASEYGDCWHYGFLMTNLSW